MNPTEIREGIAYLDECLRALHAEEDGSLRDLSEQEQTDFDAGIAERARLVSLLARHDAVAKTASTPERTERTEGPQVIRKGDPYAVLEDRSATPGQIADAATRALEDKVDDAEHMAHVRSVLRRHRSDTSWARNLIARTHENYVSAFGKLITNREMFLTDDERRALAVGTNTQGGFLVPTHLDPTIILTNSGTQNAIRGISRVVTLTTGNTWNGVSSAGVTASFDAELSEVGDDSPAIANPSVPLHTARAFVAASLEAFEDVDALASDVLMLFADARDTLEGAAHATGSGTAEPTGIFTALDANTNVELTSTTAATIGLVDLDTVYYNVPARFRPRGKWLMNPKYALAIKDLGTAVSASFSGDLRDPSSSRIFGKDVVESDDAPSAQTTTVKDNEIVYGDFSQFLIVDKPGSTSVEFIPVLMGATNSRPIGARGWFAHWRTGSDSLVDTAFRLLQDKTSA